MQNLVGRVEKDTTPLLKKKIIKKVELFLKEETIDKNQNPQILKSMLRYLATN